MNACEGHTVDLLLYLDDELDGGKLLEFLAHLKLCAQCRASLGEQIELSATLRRSRPLYSAPPKLRAKVAATLFHPLTGGINNRRYDGIGQKLRATLQNAAQWFHDGR